MALTRCRYCEHDNPANSKFCNSCGGALQLPVHLASCPRCGTVNPVKATVCCWCGGQLSGRRSLPRLPSQVIVGTAVLAVSAFGYYTYRQLSFAEAPQPPAASGVSSGRVAPAEAGFLDVDAAASARKSADDGAGPTSPATSPSEAPPAAPMRAAAIPPRAGRQPVKSQEAKANEPEPSRSEACTEAAAAVGLCATKSVQKKEPETAAVAETAIKLRPTSGAGNAGGQEPPRPQACTEAVAALGLCTPTPAQRRE
jgi:double zinc ribbon protein